MSKPLDLSTDWHVHTSFSDGRATLAQMLEAAAEREMTRIHLTDHVREDTTWLPDYVREIAHARRAGTVELVCGVEAKMLDVRGTLDVPADLAGVEQITVADHRFPTRRGPVAPEEMRRRIEAGEVQAVDVVADLVTATSRAVFAHQHTVVGHLFSVLPKARIDVSVVTADMLDTLARAVQAAGAVIEVNEKWRTPSLRLIRELCARGVDLVPASDAHRTEELGRWDFVAAAAETIVN